MVEISQFVEKWNLLYPYLNVDESIVNDAERSYTTEVDRKRYFFRTWKERKGSEATYHQLIYALLQINCRNTAEKICSLLASKWNSLYLVSLICMTE